MEFAFASVESVGAAGPVVDVGLPLLDRDFKGSGGQRDDGRLEGVIAEELLEWMFEVAGISKKLFGGAELAVGEGSTRGRRAGRRDKLEEEVDEDVSMTAFERLAMTNKAFAR